MTKSANQDMAALSVETSVNEVRIVGRLAGVQPPRVLPSGDVVVSFRVVTRRPRPRRKVSVDTLDCAVWTAGLRRTVERWAVGDTVEVSGALRRRFFRAGGAPVSRVEVEVSRARRVARAGTPGPAP